jgi:hypothetical protein
LPLDEFRIFGKEKNAPLEKDAVRTLGYRAMQQRRIHCKILSQNQPGERRFAIET